jgi:hypothetical protein
MPKKKTNFAQMIVRELRAPEPDSHFYHCAKCGQRKDMRELRDVFFHETDHKPNPRVPRLIGKRIKTRRR